MTLVYDTVIQRRFGPLLVVHVGCMFYGELFDLCDYVVLTHVWKRLHQGLTGHVEYLPLNIRNGLVSALDEVHRSIDSSLITAVDE